MEKMGLGRPVKITSLNEQQAIEQGTEIFQNAVEITFVCMIVYITLSMYLFISLNNFQETYIVLLSFYFRSHENALQKENALLKQISDLKDELDLCKVRDREQIYKIKQLDEKINRIINNLRPKVLSSLMKVADGGDSSNCLPVNSSNKRTIILERSGVIGVEYCFDNEPFPLKSPSHNYYSSSIPNEEVSNPRDLIGRSARKVALHLFSKPDESNFSTILPLLLFTSVLILYLCD